MEFKPKCQWPVSPNLFPLHILPCASSSPLQTSTQISPDSNFKWRLRPVWTVKNCKSNVSFKSKLDYECPASSHNLSKIWNPSNINTICSNFKIFNLNAQSATNEIDENAMLSDDFQTEIHVISEHSFSDNNIYLFKLDNYSLAVSYQRQELKWGAIAVLVKDPIQFQPFDTPSKRWPWFWS